ncbi:hypothetical protein P3S67_022811 [Capsicum chacoense]
MSTPSSNFFFFLFIILLLFFTFSYAAYLPQQGFLEATLNKNQHQVMLLNLNKLKQKRAAKDPRKENAWRGELWLLILIIFTPKIKTPKDKRITSFWKNSISF